MKRWMLLVWSILISWGALQAQEAKQCFVAMPDSLLPLLSAVNRADFIDFMESQMKAEVTNNLAGKSEMTALSADYIRVKLSEQSDWQMKLLPLNDSVQVIGTVTNVYAPAADCHFRFFTTDWHELPADRFLPVKPCMTDFIQAAPDSVDVYTYDEAVRPVDMLLMQAGFHADDHTLSFGFATLAYLAKDDAERLKPFVRSPLVYRWQQGKFQQP